MKNLVIFDFETCQDYSFQDKKFQNLSHLSKAKAIKERTFPIELSFILIDNLDNPKIKKGFSSKIKIPYIWDDLSEVQRHSLIFNYFDSQEDICRHNENAKPINDVFNFFFLKVQKTFNLDPFVLVGFNNFNYDNFVLQKYLDCFLVHNVTAKFLENSFDLLKFIRDIRAKKYFIDFHSWFSFYNSNNLTLEGIHKKLFKKGFEAHNSFEDCKATLRVLRFYYKNFKNLVEEFYNDYICEYDLSHNLLIHKSSCEKPKLNIGMEEVLL